MYFKKDFLNKLFRLGFLLTIMLVVLDLLVYFYYPDTPLSKILLATREQTPLTWVSIIVLLLIGLSSATVYKETGNKIWYLLSILFLFFSMDDGTYFHERLARALQTLLPSLNNFPSYSWVVLYIPFLLFAVLGLIYMLWKDSNKKEKKTLLLAVLVLSIALGLDLMDGLILKDSSLVFCLTQNCNSSVTHLVRLSEETLEVLGFGVFAYLNIKEHSFLNK